MSVSAMSVCRWCAALTVFLAVAQGAQSDEQPVRFTDAIERVDACVVSIVTELSDRAPILVPAGAERVGRGSGVIVDASGLIVTSHHVIEHADATKVVLADGRERDAVVVGVDPRTDIAVLKIEAQDIAVASFADSDEVRVGDWVLAIGSPFGLQRSVTKGIISARGRADMRITDYEDFLQTDAPMNPGNSGGPLVNLRGEIVGINTAISARAGVWSGIGFAVPSNVVENVYSQLVESGRVARGYLGIVGRTANPDDDLRLDGERVFGALVEEVDAGSPAADAGLLPADVVMAVNARRVHSMRELRSLIAVMRPGDAVTLTALRGGQALECVAVLDELEPPGDLLSIPDLGLTLAPVTPGRARLYGHRDDVLGVIVAHVHPSGAAAAAGLARGDLVTQIDDDRISSLRDANAALLGRAEADDVRFRVRDRDGTEKNLNLFGRRANMDDGGP